MSSPSGAAQPSLFCPLSRFLGASPQVQNGALDIIMGCGQTSADHQPEWQGALLPPAGVEAAVTLLRVSQSPWGRSPRLFLWCFIHQSDDSGRLLSSDRMVSFDLRGRRRRAVGGELPPFGSGTLFDLLFSQNFEISWKITTRQKEKQHFFSGYTFFSNCFYCFCGSIFFS